MTMAAGCSFEHRLLHLRLERLLVRNDCF